MIDLNPPPPPPPHFYVSRVNHIIFTFQELIIARLRKPDKCPVSFRIEPLRLFSISLQVSYKTKTKLIRIDNRSHPATPTPTALPEKTLRGGSKTGTGRRRKSSPQTHLFITCKLIIRVILIQNENITQ